MMDIAAQDAFRKELAQFTGSEEFYIHWTGVFRYTEGVRFLAERAGLFWLIDLIASWQPKAREEEPLREFQLWELKVTGSQAVAICSRDADDEAFRQAIAYTDCPLDYVRLYVEGDVLLLPSEH